MGFAEAIQSGFKNFTNFQGRASVKEWLWFFLFQVIVDAVISIITGMTTNDSGASPFKLIGTLIGLILFIPFVAVSVRRFHDRGQSGIRFLINLLPVIGLIIFIVWSLGQGDAGANRFGPNPENPNAGTQAGSPGQFNTNVGS